MIELLVRLLAGVVLLGGNAFFVGTEFALTRLRQLPEREVLDDGDPGLERAWSMTERLEIHLTGCQLGITICSIGLGVAAEPAITELFGLLFGALGGAGTRHAVSGGVGFAVLNLAHLVVGEQAPTYLGVERTKQIAARAALPMHTWTRVMSPVILTADWLAKRLLGLLGVKITRSWMDEDEGGRTRGREAMSELLAQSELDTERQQEVLAAWDIGERTVDDIATPAGDIVALRLDETIMDNLNRVLPSHRVRYPLIGENLNEFRGIIYVPELLEALDRTVRLGQNVEEAVDLEELAHDPLTLPAELDIARAIDRFQQENHEMALVERDGVICGLVTSTDAMEAITGQLRDPLD